MERKDSFKEKQKSSDTETHSHPNTLIKVSKSKSEEIVAGSSNKPHKPEKDVKFASASIEKDTKLKDKGLKLGDLNSPKVSRKYFTNWRQACDKTKDRTKELLKRWRTLPETDLPEDQDPQIDEVDEKKPQQGRGWSVHVWTTWVNRYSVDGCDGAESQDGDTDEEPLILSVLQAEKLSLFFTELLDNDHDDWINEQDFQIFCEKLAHFADWSFNSPEFHILLEVKNEFVEHFIKPLSSNYTERYSLSRSAARLPPGMVDMQNWLARWPLYLPSCSRFHQLPLFLQYFCKILFGVINKSGSGNISKDEIRAFYISLIGLSPSRCDEIIDTAFNSLTCNGHLNLDFETFKRCYSNWLCGKNPNGAGQWILVPPKGSISREPYPVDYSALNGGTGRLERYTPNNRTSRHSVIV